MKKNISPKIVSLIFSALIICFALGFYAFAVWQEPTLAPPGGNVPAPLNTSSQAQAKIGGLILNTGGFPNGLIVDQGNVGIGTTSPGVYDGQQAKLDVDGYIAVNDAWLKDVGRWASERDSAVCIRVNSNDLDDDGDYVVNLIVNGENICGGEHGCSVRAWSIWDSDMAKAGQPRSMMHSGFFIRVTGNWRWVYDDDFVAETRGINGNSTETEIFARIDSNTDCELFDDKAPFNDVDTFVLHDDDGDERCYVSICKRD